MVIKNPEQQKFVQSVLFNSTEGVSVPIERYRDRKMELMKVLGRIARGEGLMVGIKSEVPGIQQRLITTPVEAIQRTEVKNVGRATDIDRILQREELIEAGFKEQAVDKEFGKMNDELLRDYFGKRNRRIREEEYERLKTPIEYADEDLEGFGEEVQANPVLANGRTTSDYRRDVRFFRFVRKK